MPLLYGRSNIACRRGNWVFIGKIAIKNVQKRIDTLPIGRFFRFLGKRYGKIRQDVL